MESKGSITIRRAGIAPERDHPDTYSGCWKFSLGTEKLTVCSHCRKMLEIPIKQQLTLEDFCKMLDYEELNRIIREFKLACVSDTKFEVQIKVITPTGKIKWFRIAGAQFYRRRGRAKQMVGLIEDTTQHVNEECLSLAVVNHELRNPLTTIKLNVQLLINLLSRSQDKYPVKVLNTVDLHINCMTSLIEQYLTAPANEQRRTALNLTIFELNELVDIIINEIKRLYCGYQFIKQNETTVWIQADKYKIVQVFINYLTNAVKFSPCSSQISIGITCNSTNVEVAIRDQGIGIQQGEEAKLFQKFYRADLKSSRHKNSKGLGLYLVKTIITAHGGEVRAEKGFERGSVFYFSLPIYRRELNELPLGAGAH